MFTTYTGFVHFCHGQIQALLKGLFKVNCLVLEESRPTNHTRLVTYHMTTRNPVTNAKTRESQQTPQCSFCCFCFFVFLLKYVSNSKHLKGLYTLFKTRNWNSTISVWICGACCEAAVLTRSQLCKPLNDSILFFCFINSVVRVFRQWNSKCPQDANDIWKGYECGNSAD